MRLNPLDPIAQIGEEIFNRQFLHENLNKVAATIGLTKNNTNYAKKYWPRSNNYFTIPNGVNQKFSIIIKKIDLI